MMTAKTFRRLASRLRRGDPLTWCGASAWLVAGPAAALTVSLGWTEGVREEISAAADHAAAEIRAAEDRANNSGRLRAAAQAARRVADAEEEAAEARNALKLADQENAWLRLRIAGLEGNPDSEEQLGELARANQEITTLRLRAASLADENGHLVREAENGTPAAAARAEAARWRAEAEAAEADAARETQRRRRVEALDTAQRDAAMWIAAAGLTVTLALVWPPVVRIAGGGRRLRAKARRFSEQAAALGAERASAAAERDAARRKTAAEAAKRRTGEAERKKLLAELDTRKAERDNAVRRADKTAAQLRTLTLKLATAAQLAADAEQELKRKADLLLRQEDRIRELNTKLRKARAAAASARRAAQNGSGRSQLEAGMQILGVTERGNVAAAKAAYRRVAQTVHPDVCRGPEAGRLMRLATETVDMLTRACGPAV